MLTAWNGLMIGALARAWRVLGDHRYGDSARRCARFLATRLRDPGSGRLFRRFRLGDAGVEAQLSDYAFFASGLTDLYEASGEDEWLRLAIALTETQIDLFHDRENGGFFDTSGNDPSLLVRMKDMYDGAEPAGNSVAAMNLLRLSVITGKEGWRDIAEGVVARATQILLKQPVATPLMASCAAELLSGSRQLVVAGTPGDPLREEMVDLAFRNYHPSMVVIHNVSPPTPRLVNPSVGTYLPIGGKATAYLCRDFRCELPVSDAGALSRLLLRKD